MNTYDIVHREPKCPHSILKSNPNKGHYWLCDLIKGSHLGSEVLSCNEPCLLLHYEKCIVSIPERDAAFKKREAARKKRENAQAKKANRNTKETPKRKGRPKKEKGG